MELLGYLRRFRFPVSGLLYVQWEGIGPRSRKIQPRVFTCLHMCAYSLEGILCTSVELAFLQVCSTRVPTDSRIGGGRVARLQLHLEQSDRKVTRSLVGPTA